jgi:hypothetical protein
MYTHALYAFKSDGSTVALTGRALFECSAEVIASGTGPGGVVVVPRYTYSYADKLKQLLDATGNLKAGSTKVDGVSNLLLTIETMATAKYAWHVDLNDAAAAVAGMKTVFGQGEAVFRKQPDGAWVLPES